MRILHCFADRGAECETLQQYGKVIRVGIDAKPNGSSQAIKADAKRLPFAADTTFDLGVFHPPCTKWSDMPDADKDGDAENLIPLAREIATAHCDEWIIENKPKAPLQEPVCLTGYMFNLPVEYERAFETSFSVPQPPRQERIAETSPFFYSERSPEWWAAVKGTSTDYPKEHMAKNTIPAAYLRYLIQYWAKAHVNGVDRERYATYRDDMDTERAKQENAELSNF